MTRIFQYHRTGLVSYLTGLVLLASLASAKTTLELAPMGVECWQVCSSDTSNPTHKDDTVNSATVHSLGGTLMPHPGGHDAWLFTEPGNPNAATAAARAGALRIYNVSTSRVESVPGMDAWDGLWAVVNVTSKITTTINGTNGTNVTLNTTTMTYYVSSEQYHTLAQLKGDATSGSESGAVEVAGSRGSPGYLGGTGPDARFDQPRGLVAYEVSPGAVVELLVADMGNHRIRAMNVGSFKVIDVAGNGVMGSLDGMGAVSASLYSPTAIALYTGPNTTSPILYVAELTGLLRAVNLVTLQVSTPCGLLAEPRLQDGTCGSTARLLRVTAIWADDYGLVISDGPIIRSIAIHAGLVLEITSLTGNTSADMAYGPAPLSSGPTSSVLVDNATFGENVTAVFRAWTDDGVHQVAIMDHGNLQVRRTVQSDIKQNVNVNTWSGSRTSTPADAATFAAANFSNSLGGIAICPNRRIYVSDGPAIREIPTLPNTKTVTFTAPPFFVQGSVSLACNFRHEVYGVTSAQHVAFMLKVGTYSVYGGQLGTAGFATGDLLTTATFNAPRGIVEITDKVRAAMPGSFPDEGFVVVDHGSNLVRIIDAASKTITHNIGTGQTASIDGGGNGSSVLVAFHRPCGLAFREHDGLFYVSECDGSFRIRLVNLTGFPAVPPQVSTVVGTGSYGLYDNSPTGTTQPRTEAYLSSTANIPLAVRLEENWYETTSTLYFFDGNHMRQLQVRRSDTSPQLNMDQLKKLSYDFEAGFNDAVDVSISSWDRPAALLYDSGVLYVTDTGNSRVRSLVFNANAPNTIYDQKTMVNIVSKVGGAGPTGTPQADKKSNYVTSYFRPYGVYIYREDEFYFTDPINNAIHRVQLHQHRAERKLYTWKVDVANFPLFVRPGFLQKGNYQMFVSFPETHQVAAFGLFFNKPTWKLWCGSNTTVPGDADNSGCGSNAAKSTTAAHFNRPQHIVTTWRDDLTICDEGNNKIRVIKWDSGNTYAGGPISTKLGNGDAATVDHQDPLQASLNRPYYLVSAWGDRWNYHTVIFWVEGDHRSVIRRANFLHSTDMTRGVQNVVTVIGDPTKSEHQDGPKESALLRNVQSIGYDHYTGDLYITDANTIRHISFLDLYVTTIAGQPTEPISAYATGDRYESKCSYNLTGVFRQEWSSYMYYMDFDNGYIMKVSVPIRREWYRFDKSALEDGVPAIPSTTTTVDSYLPEKVQFDSPTVRALCACGTAPSDAYRHERSRVLVWIAEGRLLRQYNWAAEITTIATMPGTIGGIACVLNRAYAYVTIKHEIMLTLVDQFVVVNMQGNTTAGQFGLQGSKDGPLLYGAQLHSPSSIQLNRNDNSYLISEVDNHCIRRMSLEEDHLSTLTGTPGSSGSLDGLFTVATFTSPDSIAIDSWYRMRAYVVEPGLGRIRRLGLQTSLVSTFYERSKWPITWDGKTVWWEGNVAPWPHHVAVNEWDGLLIVATKCGLNQVQPSLPDDSSVWMTNDHKLKHWYWQPMAEGGSQDCGYQEGTHDNSNRKIQSASFPMTMSPAYDIFFFDTDVGVLRTIENSHFWPDETIRRVAGQVGVNGSYDSNETCRNSTITDKAHAITGHVWHNEIVSLWLYDAGSNLLREFRRWGSVSWPITILSDDVRGIAFEKETMTLVFANTGHNNVVRISIVKETPPEWYVGGAQKAPWAAGNVGGVEGDANSRFDRPSSISYHTKGRRALAVGELGCRMRGIAEKKIDYWSIGDGTCQSIDGYYNTMMNVASVVATAHDGHGGNVFIAEEPAAIRVMHRTWDPTPYHVYTILRSSRDPLTGLMPTVARAAGLDADCALADIRGMAYWGHGDLYITMGHGLYKLRWWESYHRMDTVSGSFLGQGMTQWATNKTGHHAWSKDYLENELDFNTQARFGRFNNPKGIVVLGGWPNGIYVVDSGNMLIQEVADHPEDTRFNDPNVNKKKYPNYELIGSRTASATKTARTSSFSATFSFSTSFSIGSDSVTLSPAPTLSYYADSRTKHPTNTNTFTASLSLDDTASRTPYTFTGTDTATLTKMETPPLTGSSSISFSESLEPTLTTSMEFSTSDTLGSPSETMETSVSMSVTDKTQSETESFALSNSTSLSLTETPHPEPYFVGNVSSLGQEALYLERVGAPETRSIKLQLFGTEFDIALADAETKATKKRGLGRTYWFYRRLYVYTNSTQRFGFTAKRTLLWKLASIRRVEATAIWIEFQSHRSYFCTQEEVLGFRFNKQAFASRKDSKEFTLPLKYTPRSSLDAATVDSATGVVGGASVVSGALGGASAAQAARSQALLALDECVFDYDDPPPRLVNPIKEPISHHKTKWYTGQMIFNPIFLVGVSLAHVWAGHLVAECKKIPFKTGLAIVRFPHFTFLPYMMLMQDSITATVVVLLHHPSDVYKMIAMICSLFWMAFTVAVCTIISPKFGGKFIPPTTEERRSPFVAFFIGQGDWGDPVDDHADHEEPDDESDEERDADEHALLDDSKPITDAASSKAATEKTLVEKKKKRAEKAKKKRKKLIAQAFPSGFCLMYGSMFDSYRYGRHWFCVVEFFAIIGVGIVMGLQPDDGDCTNVAMAIAIILGIFMVILIVLRPFFVPLNQIANAILAVLQFTSALLISLSGSQPVETSAIMKRWASMLAILSMYVAGAKAVVEVLVLGVDMFYSCRGESDRPNKLLDLLKRVRELNSVGDDDLELSGNETPLLDPDAFLALPTAGGGGEKSGEVEEGTSNDTSTGGDLPKKTPLTATGLMGLGSLTHRPSTETREQQKEKMKLKNSTRERHLVRQRSENTVSNWLRADPQDATAATGTRGDEEPEAISGALVTSRPHQEANPLLDDESRVEPMMDMEMVSPLSLLPSAGRGGGSSRKKAPPPPRATNPMDATPKGSESKRKAGGSTLSALLLDDEAVGDGDSSVDSDL